MYNYIKGSIIGVEGRITTRYIYFNKEKQFLLPKLLQKKILSQILQITTINFLISI